MSGGSITLVGLDLETTGSDIDAGAVPIQLGVAYGDEYASWYVNPRQCDNKYVWSDEAEKVHGISRDDAEKNGEHPLVVSARAVVWLAERDVLRGARMDRWPLGWNVGSFDMPFVRRYMPPLADWFSYRSMDLNAVCEFATVAHGEQFSTLKKKAKQAAELADARAAWHDAGFDALAALRCHPIKFSPGSDNQGTGAGSGLHSPVTRPGIRGPLANGRTH